jgi:hypothetical protein
MKTSENGLQQPSIRSTTSDCLVAAMAYQIIADVDVPSPVFALAASLI